jgi:hypothetical protein
MAGGGVMLHSLNLSTISKEAACVAASLKRHSTGNSLAVRLVRASWDNYLQIRYIYQIKV